MAQGDDMKLWRWICPSSEFPDFKQIVEKTLAVFAVFTGATFTFYVNDFLLVRKPLPPGFGHFSLIDRVLVLAAVMSLLVRYITGSAVHLNAAYVPKTTQVVEPTADNPKTFAIREIKSPHDRSIGLLFFDIMLLVGFGILAVFITLASTMRELLIYSLMFVLGGFIWSLIAMLRPVAERAIAKRWLLIDGAQAAITAGLICLSISDIRKAWVLAAVYVFCLFLDFAVLSRPSEAWQAPAKPPLAA